MIDHPRMAIDDAQPFGQDFPADDEAEDARWLATLLAALHAQIASHGYGEAASVLTDAISGAEALARGPKPHDGQPERQEPDPASNHG